MKLMTPFYLCLLIALFMQNIHFNELHNLQKVLSHSKCSQEVCVVFAQIPQVMSPLPGTAYKKQCSKCFSDET